MFAEKHVEQAGDDVINLIALCFLGIALLITPAIPSLLREWYPGRSRASYVGAGLLAAAAVLGVGGVLLLQLLDVMPYRGE